MAVYDHLQAMKWVFVQWLKSLAPKALVEILGLGLNLCEEAIEFVRSEINVLDAGGIYLEGIGAKFGVARGGMTDEVYRAAIIVEARSLFASGDSAAVLGLMRALLPPEAVLHETEFYPHCFVVFVQEASLEILDILAQLMEDVPALTVNGAFGWIDDEVLSYGDVDGDPDVVISAGFGDVDGDIVDGVAGLAAVIPI